MKKIKKKIFFNMVTALILICLLLERDNHVIKKDNYVKATTVTKNKITENVHNSINNSYAGSYITVGLWLSDIDYNNIERQALRNMGFNRIEDIDSRSVQTFIETKRELIKDAYTAYNTSFSSKYISDENALFISEYAPYIIAKIPSKSVEEIADNAEVTSVDMYFDLPKRDETSSSIPNISANYTRDNMMLTGKGVKVGILEMGYPNMNTSQLKDRNIILDTSNNNASAKVSPHATKVTSIVVGNTLGIVPDAAVYLATSDDRAGDFEKIEWMISQGVNVINYSAGYDNVKGIYTDMAKWIDHLSYQLNVIFVKSAGNGGSDECITDPGMAFNGLTVGAISDNDSSNEPNWKDDEFASYSAYREADGGFKPDLTAPGHNISVPGYVTASGTSYSAPHVTGVVAQLFQLKPDLKLKPSALNAILKAGTNHKTADDYGQYSLSPDYSNKEGAGVVDAMGAYTTASANQYVGIQLNNNSFPYSKEITISDTTKPVRVVINWLKQNSLVDGSIINNELSDLDLYVYKPNGTLMRSCCSANNNTELVEFIPDQKGTYKIVVEGYLLENTHEILGLSWNQADAKAPIPEETTSPFIPPVATTKSWNFSDNAFRALGTLTSEVTVDDLTLLATSNKSMKVQKLTTTLNNKKYDYCLSLEGVGTTSYRAIRFKVEGPCSIETICKSNGSLERILGIYNSNQKELSTFNAGLTLSSQTYTYTGGADTLYISSKNSGINVYSLKVTYHN